jgi:hypothetical protein
MAPTSRGKKKKKKKNPPHIHCKAQLVYDIYRRITAYFEEQKHVNIFSKCQVTEC